MISSDGLVNVKASTTTGTWFMFVIGGLQLFIVGVIVMFGNRPFGPDFSFMLILFGLFGIMSILCGIISFTDCHKYHKGREIDPKKLRMTQKDFFEGMEEVRSNQPKEK